MVAHHRTHRIQCPAFFRMIGRIEEDLSAGSKSFKDDIIFEVDMENVVHGKANLFTYMHNMSDKPRTLSLEFNHQISDLMIFQ